MFSGVRILMKGKAESLARYAASAVFPHPVSPGREGERVGEGERGVEEGGMWYA